MLRADKTSQDQASYTELCLLPRLEASCADCPFRAMGKRDHLLLQKSGRILPDFAAAHILVIFVMRLLNKTSSTLLRWLVPFLVCPCHSWTTFGLPVAVRKQPMASAWTTLGPKSASSPRGLWASGGC